MLPALRPLRFLCSPPGSAPTQRPFCTPSVELPWERLLLLQLSQVGLSQTLDKRAVHGISYSTKAALLLLIRYPWAADICSTHILLTGPGCRFAEWLLGHEECPNICLTCMIGSTKGTVLLFPRCPSHQICFAIFTLYSHSNSALFLFLHNKNRHGHCLVTSTYPSIIQCPIFPLPPPGPNPP